MTIPRKETVSLAISSIGETDFVNPNKENVVDVDHVSCGENRDGASDTDSSKPMVVHLGEAGKCKIVVSALTGSERAFDCFFKRGPSAEAHQSFAKLLGLLKTEHAVLTSRFGSALSGAKVTPKCIGSHVSDDGCQGLFLFQDVSNTHTPGNLAVTLEKTQMNAAIDTLGYLHGLSITNDIQSDIMNGSIPTSESRADLWGSIFAGSFSTSLDGFEVKWKDVATPGFVQAVKNELQRNPSAVENIFREESSPKDGPRVLIHGDAKSENFMFAINAQNDNSKCLLVDWATSSLGGLNGAMHDVANLLTLSCDTDMWCDDIETLLSRYENAVVTASKGAHKARSASDLEPAFRDALWHPLVIAMFGASKLPRGIEDNPVLAAAEKRGMAYLTRLQNAILKFFVEKK